MTMLEKEKLMSVLEDLDNMRQTVESLIDNYGVRLNAMTVDDVEHSNLKFDLDTLGATLGNLHGYISQYIKEEEKYSNEERG